MFSLGSSNQFYFYAPPTDMRKGFDTLSGLIRSKMQRNPLSGEVFIFVNKTRNRMKLLHWESGGFVLYYKRLEQGRFESLKHKNISNNALKVSWTELAMIVEGISVKNIVKKKRFSVK